VSSANDPAEIVLRDWVKRAQHSQRASERPDRRQQPAGNLRAEEETCPDYSEGAGQNARQAGALDRHRQ
jgi:hypothetical protein